MPPRDPYFGPAPFLLSAALLAERVPAGSPFPYSLPAVRRLSTLRFHPRVTFFVGENGSGKSTLLEAIAEKCELNPEGGSRNMQFATRASHSRLAEALFLDWAKQSPRDSYFLRAESFYNVATEIEKLDRIAPEIRTKIGDGYGRTPLHEQSHGEAFFALFKHRFRDRGLYLMDEPEAALSPQRQLQFLALLHDYVRAGCQFVIATHSPIIMAYPDAAILAFGPDGVAEVPYAETEHYKVTRSFLDSPKRMLKILLADEEPA